MRYTLEQLFNQAVLDHMSTILDSPCCEARMVYGCKIIKDKDTGSYVIFNTTKGGDFYQELTDQEMEIFYAFGWRIGVYAISLENYKRKLGTIEQLIRKEMNSRQNPKIITSLKSHRERILIKYNTITQKLNHEK
jgi:hypothetical protein